MLVISPSKPTLVPVASVGCANTAAISVELPKQSPSAARNAVGATFAWGPFRPLAFQGPTLRQNVRHPLGPIRSKFPPSGY